MSGDRLSVADLRDRVEALGVDLRSGTTAGYHRYETDFALGSVAIAFGEDRAVYDESAFPGVVYPAADLGATIVVSGDGTVAVLDASDGSHAADAIAGAVETLEDLYLLDGSEPIETSIPASEIPFSLDPPDVETIGGSNDD
ncbi:hypothetical protein [Halobellus sp. GM3]|uniref:hypothetical protein n=1 Tax=Halobellus sp. GM3 TaxID=3458410 RepID=UPI00403E31E2